MQTMKNFSFTLWDVGHGLAIWIKTPAGHNHWVDAGQNAETDFSPAERVANYWRESKLDYLIISHPDADHIGGLPDVIHYLGKPRVLSRNKSIPDDEKYGSEDREYQKVFAELDKTYNSPVMTEHSPTNPDYNGGINIKTGSLDYNEVTKINDTSIVALYLLDSWLFVCPGDIEPIGWEKLWEKKKQEFSELINDADVRILVAPHHGRASGYSQEMIDTIQPHLVLISDKYGQQPTDGRFRQKPLGLGIDGEETKFLSTKTSGRIRFVYENGSWKID
jgi:competence protein ComEC